MARCAIYTTNTSAQALTAGSIIPVGSTTRRFGKSIRQDGNTITLMGEGYYHVNASATLIPSAAGTVTVTGQKDGVAVVGATASATVAAVSTATNLNLDFIVRNICGCSSSILSFVLTGADATLSNLAVTVEKL